ARRSTNSNSARNRSPAPCSLSCPVSKVFPKYHLQARKDRPMLQPPSTPALPDRYDAVHRRRLFILCCLPSTPASMSFVLRSSIAQDIQPTLFDPIDPLNSATLIGSALGVAFLSMATAVAIGSPLLDAIGMRNLLALCGLAFVAGTGLTIFADQISSGPGV